MPAAKKSTSSEPKTVTLQDAYGNDVKVPVGMDGENPVSPNNPAPKSSFFSETDEQPELQPGVAETVAANMTPSGDERFQTVEAAKNADSDAKSDEA